MGTALCGCLVFLVVCFWYVRAARRRAAAAEAARQDNALDVGLALLIKDISRHAEAPRAPIAPRTRTPQGTPIEVASTRLRAVTSPAFAQSPLAHLFDEDDDDEPTAHAYRTN